MHESQQVGCTRCRDLQIPPPACPHCQTKRKEHVEARGLGGFANERDDLAIERRFRVWAPPVVFALAALVMSVNGLREAARIFITMWLHELGHAAAAWLTGFGAIPGPWRTSISASRSVWVTLLLLAVLGGIAWKAKLQKWPRWISVGLGALGAVALAGALILSESTARLWFTFFGDGGMMLIGTALVLTFWANPGSHLHESWLRWGFLCFGALGICEGFATWWPCRSDPSMIPYGEIEGVGLSDPTVLFDAGWPQDTIVSRFVTVGVLCLLVVSLRYAAALYRMWRDPECVA